MKPKIAPTSPKTEQEHRDFEKLYTGELQTIDRPHRIPLGLTLGLSFAVGIMGVVGALAGLTALRQRLPETSWIRFFIPTGSDTVIVKDAPRPSPPDTPNEEQRREVAAQLVSVYQDLPDSAQSVSDLPTPGRWRGDGVIVSNDGLIITTRDVVPEAASTYSLVLSDRRILPVKRIILDPVTPFVFLSVTGTDLRPVKFAPEEAATLGASATVYSQSGLPDTISVTSTSITTLAVRAGTDADTLIESSDTLDRILLVAASGLEKGSPVVSDRGEVLGLALGTTVAGHQAVAPLWTITSPLRQILKGTDLLRPSLGVHYIDLSRVPSLASAPVQTGALLTTDDPKVRPAVVPKGAAAVSKLQSGDIVEKVNGTFLDAAASLNDVVQDFTAGETVTLTVLRNGKEQSIKVKLGVVRP